MSRAAEMRRVLSRWEGSGLTQREFAEREGVPYTTLLYWRRRTSGRSAASGKRAAPVFTPVRVVSEEPRTLGVLQLRSPRGVVVSVPGEVPTEALRRLLEVLREC